MGRKTRGLLALGISLVMLAALRASTGDTLAAAPGPAGSPLAAVATSPRAAGGPAVGVQFHGMWDDVSDTQRAQVLDRLVAARVGWVRLDLSWAMLQPQSRGAYDMTWGVPFADRVIDMIHARGLRLLVTFWLTPSWANGGAGERALPTSVTDYAAAARWAAHRWASQVDAWEVWNEPNHDDFMTGADPRRYAALLMAAYPAIHAGDSNARVVFGGPSENDVAWISSALRAGAFRSFDVMATHPYQQPSDLPPETADNGSKFRLTHVSRVHDLMKRYGVGGKPIWFTEFGWSSHANTSSTPPWERGVTESQQADYLVRTLRLLASRYPYVTNAFWYTERDRDAGGTGGSATTSTVHANHFGLLRTDLTPKPAYAALRAYLAS